MGEAYRQNLGRFFETQGVCAFFVWGIWGGEYVRFAWVFFFFVRFFGMG